MCVYVYICGITEELQLVKGNTNKHKHGARFWDLDIKSRDGKFKVGLFDKKDSFPFYIIRMIDESSSLLANINLTLSTSLS